jgi:hypothetical protein
MRPGDRILQSQWDRRIGSRGLNGTADILWHRGNPYKNECWFSFPLKGNYRKKNTYVDIAYLKLLENVNIKGELWQKISVSDLGDFQIYFLGEYEAICKTALGLESGP